MAGGCIPNSSSCHDKAQIPWLGIWGFLQPAPCLHQAWPAGHPDTCLYPQSDTSFLPPPPPPVLLLQLLPLGILEMQMHRIPGPATTSAVPSAPILGGLTHPGRLHCPSP